MPPCSVKCCGKRSSTLSLTKDEITFHRKPEMEQGSELQEQRYVATPDGEDLKMQTDLEEALDLAGTGKYQIFHFALMLASLSSAMIEMIGNAFILPAAACDLHLPDSLRGIITSVPNIGVILTFPLWGRAADTLGRRPILILSATCTGIICMAASVMPNLASFALCKFAGSLLLSCPSSLGFAYAGEMISLKRRDFALLLLNGFLVISSVLSPLIAWAILSYDPMDSISLRPWRLLTAVYALPLILVGLWMIRADESPKFLVTKGKDREALEVLAKIYATNTGEDKDSYCVTALKKPRTSVESISTMDSSGADLLSQQKSEGLLELLRPPHFKWLALTGFLMFGLFSLLNGLFLFAPDTINKMMQEPSDDKNICELINRPDNQTSPTTCADTISHDTFLVMVLTTTVYGVLVMGASLCPVSKKTLLVIMYITVGVACLLSELSKNRMVAGAAMSALQLTSLGIGPLTAYAVHLFPTTLRATAVGAVMMFGRLGSVVGANVAGILLESACAATFYGFSGLLLVCAFLCLLLPDSKPSSSSSSTSEVDST